MWGNAFCHVDEDKKYKEWHTDDTDIYGFTQIR